MKIKTKVLVVKTRSNGKSDWLFGEEVVTGKKVLFKERPENMKTGQIWLCLKRKDLVNYVIVEPVEEFKRWYELERLWAKRQEEYFKERR